MLNDLSILITGGTGSFGRAFVKNVLAEHRPKRLVVFSRDELKQYEMSNIPGLEPSRVVRYFLGDVRDRDRLRRALEGIDIVVHAAALKQVVAAEYNPFEFIKTNIMGAQNLVEACVEAGVSKVVALSTDKAAAPVNLYGATKLCSDKLFVAANNFLGRRDLKFSVVRYGNVMGSRGSVIPYFLDRRKNGSLPITHPEMTRFNITLEHGVEIVLRAIEGMWGGEIFVPKIPSYRILDLARAIAPNCRHDVVGIRPGEKVHEEMITTTDSFTTAEFADHFIILPSLARWKTEDYLAAKNGRMCDMGFHYHSGTNDAWLDVPTLRRLIRRHVDPNFDVPENA
jgi:UDP-N-acetylglucosamine 4,6-dehydratase (inverting)